MANGETVDWEGVSARLGGTPDGALAERLRDLQTVVTPPGTSSAHVGRPRPALPLWIVLIYLLVAVQAAMAWAGLFVGGAAAPGSPTWLMVVTAVVYLISAATLVHARRFDRRAVWLGAFLLGAASAAAQRPLGWLTAATGTGAWLGHLLPEALLPLFLWRFVRDFPEVVHLSRWSGAIRAGIAVSAALGGLLLAANAVVPVLGAPPPILRALSRSGSLYWPVLSALILGALVVAGMRAREASRQERRRVALLLAGVCGGLGPGFVLVLLEEALPSVAALSMSPQGRLLTDLIVYLPLLAVPIFASHAVLADDVFGLGAMVRQAVLPSTVEYAAAAAAAVIGSLLAVHLSVNRDRDVGSVLAQPPAPALLIGGALALAAIGVRRFAAGRRQLWIGDGGRAGGALLSAFAQEIARLRSRAEVLTLLGDRLREVFAAQSASTWLPAGDVWVSPDAAAGPLRADSAVLALARADPSPIRVDPTDGSGMFGWLPDEEREWVSAAGIGLLVPVPGVGGEVAALAAVSAGDGGLAADERISLAGALASSAALALRSMDEEPHRLEQDESQGAAVECTECGEVSARPGACSRCGGDTRVAAVPLELNGRFRVLATLGRGGMGVAYRARDLALEREVALKTLPRVHPAALTRFRREALSMARFVDPHLALIFGLETWRGVPVLVVEYLAGGTLAARIGKPHPASTVARWGVQLAAGLEAMHAEGLLHRDVKPSNVGFTAQGTVKLLDFGLARLAVEIELTSGSPVAPLGDSVTRTSHVIGTPLYLAPEALAGEPPSPDHDLWGLALVLWEATTGRHPFGRPVTRHPGGRLDLRGSSPGVPAPLAELLESALAADVRSRPRSASEFRRGLEAFVRS